MADRTFLAHPVLGSSELSRLMSEIGRAPVGSTLKVDLRALQYAGLFDLTMLAMMAHEFSREGLSGRKQLEFILSDALEVGRLERLQDDAIKSVESRRTNAYHQLSALGWIEAVTSSGASVSIESLTPRDHIAVLRKASPNQPWKQLTGRLPEMACDVVVPVTSILTERDLRANFPAIRLACEAGMAGAGDPSVVRRLVQEVILEICDNVSKHNQGEATVGWICAVRRHTDGRLREAERQEWTGSFAADCYMADVLEILVADNGYGMWHTLGMRRHGPDYQKALGEEDAILQAFERQTPRDPQRGLFDVRQCMLDLNAGFVGARSGHSRVGFTFTWNATGAAPTRQSDAYAIKGTQVFVRLSTDKAVGNQQDVSGYEHRRRAPAGSAIRSPMPEIHALPVVWTTPTQDTRQESEEALAAGVVRAAQKVLEGPRSLLLLDLLNADKLRPGDIEKALGPAIRLYGSAFLRRIVLTNCDDTLLARMARSRVLAELLASHEFVIALDKCEKPHVLSSDLSESASDAIADICVAGSMDFTTIEAAWGPATAEVVAAAARKSDVLSVQHTPSGRTACFVPVLDALQAEFESQFEAALKETGAWRTGGHFELPCGEHAYEYLESRLLLQRSNVTTLMAKRLAVMLREQGVRQGRHYVIYTYSMTGQILADELRYWISSQRCVTATDYREPWPSDPQEDLKQGDMVVLVTDVAASGTLIARMVDHVRAAGASLVAVAVVANLSDMDEIAGRRVVQLFRRRVERHRPPCEKCRLDEPLRKVDDFTLAARPVDFPSRPLKPRVSAEARAGQARIDKDGGPEDEGAPGIRGWRWQQFWRTIQDSRGAVARGHQTLDGRCYLHQIDTHRLLADEGLRPFVQAGMVSFFEGRETGKRLIGQVDCVIHPGDRANPAAVQVARMAARSLGFPQDSAWLDVIMAHRHSLYGWDLAPESAAAMQDKRVVVVDDGTNTGRTLFELAGLALAAGAKAVSGFYVVLNRLPEAMDCFCREYLGNFGYFLRLRLPVLPQGRCPICRRMKALDAEIETSLSGDARTYAVQKLREIEANHLGGQRNGSDRTS